MKSGYQKLKDYILDQSNELPVDGEFKLSDREVAVSQFLNSLIMPALAQILEAGNAEEFMRYGKNKCRQGAFICKAFLDELLPHYSWTIYDGIFEDIIDGKTQVYNHAYVFGSPIKPYTGKRILCDMTRTTHNNLFVKRNTNSYKGINSYDNMTRKQIMPMDFEEMKQVREYFTNIQGWQLIDALKANVIFEKGEDDDTIKASNS